MQSIREIYRIGLGPSSNQTTGPKKAAMRALDCATFACYSDDSHRISFNEVVRAMKETGGNLPKNYRKTSEGGSTIIHLYPPDKKEKR